MFRIFNRLFGSSPKVAIIKSNRSKVLEDSLFARFFQYLKNDNLVVGPNLAMNFNNIQKMSSEVNRREFDKMLRKIDKESMNNILTAKVQISALIDQLIEISPSSVHELRTFKEALGIFRNQFDEKPTRENFVKLCFYYGLYKKRPPGPEKMREILAKHFDNFIDELTMVEIAIICTATFKASVKVPSRKFERRLIQEITSVKEIDSFMFICFMKSIRQNLLCPPEVVEKIRQLNDEGKFNNLDHVGVAHILPIIANNGLIEPEIMKTLVERFFVSIDDDARVKDVQKFVFSCAQVNHQLKKKHFQQIEQMLINKTDTQEYDERFDCFVDATLSLWMLNYRSQLLIDKLFKDPRLHQKGDKSRIKIDSRKLLLMTCVELEEPEWFSGQGRISESSFNANRGSPKYLIKPLLETAKQQINDENTRFVQQIKNLNIAGILSRSTSGDETHYEVLDNTNTLRDAKTPSGIFALKLRLLKHMNCKVKTVSCTTTIMYR